MIHALLLLRQSVDQRVLGSRVPQLNLNGPIINAGTFEEIVHGGDVRKPVEFSFVVDTDYKLPYYRRPTSGSLVTLYVPRPATEEGYFRQPGPRFDEARPTRVVQISMSFLPEPPFGPTLNRLDIDVDGAGRASFVRTTGTHRVQHWRTYVEDLPSKSLQIRFFGGEFFPYVSRPSVQVADSKARRRLNLFQRCAISALHELEAFLWNIKVVGPFRTPPARRYSFSGFGALDAGLSGERAVDLLITEKLTNPANPQLHKAISFWLKRLDLAKSLNIKPLAKKSAIYELLVRGAGYRGNTNFADVGFGISQVLPVLVQAFFVPRGGTYVVQQPELHLHPDAQAALADFFIYLASQGITSIVETHSEYLLLRLRRRMAEKYVPPTMGLPTETSGKDWRASPSSAAIMLVEHKANVATLRRLEVGAGFQFENMPPGFMDQSVSDRFALMKSLARQNG